jgi:hypothetical protein
MLDSYLDRLIGSQGHMVHRIRAKDTTGRWAIYFVYVRENRESAFMAAIEGDGTIDIEQYGEVLASCYGEEPTTELKLYLKEKYGFSV